jgi:electron transfer flavoprotein beta subunit
MSIAYQIVVCGSIVPDPLQTLEPVTGPAGPALKNEMMLPAILDPWASHALYEAANLAKNAPGSKVWLVSLGPKAKLQQVMMTVAQKVPFELVALDGPASGFIDAGETADALADAIAAIPGLDKSRLLVFGGWESASRGAGATMQIVGERLGITDQFQGVDELKVNADGSFEILERIEGGKQQVSKCAGAPALLGWATGNLPEPKNNPQVGMVNMRTVMPALQKAKPVKLAGEGLSFASVSLPKQLRETKIVKDKSADEIAKEIVERRLAEATARTVRRTVPTKTKFEYGNYSSSCSYGNRRFTGQIRPRSVARGSRAEQIARGFKTSRGFGW